MEKITRSFLRTFVQNSPEYVYYHGLWAKQRKKNFSARLGEIFINGLNPKSSFLVAKKIVEKSQIPRKPVFGRDGLTDLERFLGMTKQLTPVKKVPHTCYTTYS